MSEFPSAGYRLMIVDDDEMVREVLRALAKRVGFVVEGFGSGTAALERLGAGGELPHAVLTDVHMPGPSGPTFAGLARSVCGSGTVVLAMSATAISAGQLHGYDGFLRKPFSMEQMCAALEAGGVYRPNEGAEAAEVLKTATLEQLLETMGPGRLRELYRVFLVDAELRLATLRRAAVSRDRSAWRAAAHQLKGSCGMVGAAELEGLAGEWEAAELPGVGVESPIKEMAGALERLRGVVAAQLP